MFLLWPRIAQEGNILRRVDLAVRSVIEKTDTLNIFLHRSPTLMQNQGQTPKYPAVPSKAETVFLLLMTLSPVADADLEC